MLALTCGTFYSKSTSTETLCFRSSSEKRSLTESLGTEIMVETKATDLYEEYVKLSSQLEEAKKRSRTLETQLEEAFNPLIEAINRHLAEFMQVNGETLINVSGYDVYGVLNMSVQLSGAWLPESLTGREGTERYFYGKWHRDELRFNKKHTLFGAIEPRMGRYPVRIIQNTEMLNLWPQIEKALSP